MGAIGSHLAYCLYKNKAKITGVCRGNIICTLKKGVLELRFTKTK